MCGKALRAFELVLAGPRTDPTELGRPDPIRGEAAGRGERSTRRERTQRKR